MDEQAKALRELDTAKAELEEILRQLREEEMKRLLAMLEARFIKVLQIQREIYSGTLRLDKIPLVERSHSYEIDTGRLSNREAEIVMEVDKALSLLRQEGSSVAMPEAVQEVRDDMQQLVHRLAYGKTEVVTQSIETDVIKALEEIIDALKKAQKDAESKKKPPGPSPNGQPQDPPLIEQLAELKMIRALQMRVNRRTERTQNSSGRSRPTRTTSWMPCGVSANRRRGFTRLPGTWNWERTSDRRQKCKLKLKLKFD